MISVECREGCRIFPLVSDDGCIGYSVIMFPGVGQFSLSQVSGILVFLPADSQHHVVFAGVHVLLAQFVQVIHVFHADGMDGILQSVIFTVFEGVFQ